MIDRSEEIRSLFQAELDKHNDTATLRIVAHEADGNEQFCKVFIHRPMQDRFVEYDVFVDLDPITIPPYSEWAQ